MWITRTTILCKSHNTTKIDVSVIGDDVLDTGDFSVSYSTNLVLLIFLDGIVVPVKIRVGGPDIRASQKGY
jgi:hypothetical protein